MLGNVALVVTFTAGMDEAGTGIEECIVTYDVTWRVSVSVITVVKTDGEVRTEATLPEVTVWPIGQVVMVVWMMTVATSMVVGMTLMEAAVGVSGVRVTAQGLSVGVAIEPSQHCPGGY